MTGPETPQRIEVDALVRSVAFRSGDTDFAVLKVELADRTELVTAVGPLRDVAKGETIRLQGQWQTDPRFGKQIRVDGWLPATPATKEGLNRYLASGAIDGVGPELAQRIVDHFGLDTLDVLDRQPARLKEIDGIGPVRAKKIMAAWSDQREARELMVLLRGHGMGHALAVRIARHFGPRAWDICRNDPYRLALEVPGVGFVAADRLAQAQGLPLDHPVRLAAGAHHFLAEAALDGHTHLEVSELVEATSRRLTAPPELVGPSLDLLREEDRLAIEDGRAYLPKLYEAEKDVIDFVVERLGRRAASLAVRFDEVLARYQAEAGISLADAQREALQNALSHRILIITGGPGTGKTTLMKALLALFTAAKLSVRLAAPTGRAAKRLEEAAGRGHTASTLHRLLEVDPRSGQFQRGPHAPVEADALVIDEMSMVDLPLFAAVVRALSPETRLILVGDVDQLPSVGPGRVLSDLLEAELPAVRLREVFRQAESSHIVRNAHRINRGQGIERPRTGPDQPLADFYLMVRAEPGALVEGILELVAARIPDRFGLDPKLEVQVLTPMQRGPLGARALNEALQARLNPGKGGLDRGGQSFRAGDKVMQTRNDYTLGVLNGELGRVESVDEKSGTLKIRFEEEVLDYKQRDLENVSLAYACSVHKAQGSEYLAVVLVVARQHAVMLDRQLVYTAMTRARKLLVIVSTPGAMDLAVRPARQHRRRSALAPKVRQQAVTVEK